MVKRVGRKEKVLYKARNEGKKEEEIIKSAGSDKKGKEWSI